MRPWKREKSGLVVPSRGFAGVGGGRDNYIAVPYSQRASTARARGLYPWLAGSEAPIEGVPVGKTLTDDGSGITVGCDPITWFEKLALILNPSVFLLGLPGFGKSTLIKRWIMILAYWGVLAMVLGDVKGEYVALIKALGGQVISPGRGRDRINPLDIAAAQVAAKRIGGEPGQRLLADAKARRVIFVESLITIQRGKAPDGDESLLLDIALTLLDKAWSRKRHQPVLGDLDQVFADGPEELRVAALWRNEEQRYYAATDALRKSLAALTQGSGLGWVFSGQTTTPLQQGVSVCFDLSGISKQDRKLRAAAQTASWSMGFSQVAISHALADAGLEHFHRYLAVMDELWSALREGEGMVDNVDALGRLNRGTGNGGPDDYGLGTVYCSHTMEDAEALPEQDRAKARGLIERSGFTVCAALPPSEHARLRTVGRWAQSELDEISSWSTPPAWQAIHDPDEPPPGRSKFSIKVAGQNALSFELELSDVEKELSNTNKLWNAA